MNRSIKPPRLASKLLSFYCGNAAIEDLEGDLEELFKKDLENMPSWKAKARYSKYVLSLLFSYAIRRRKKDAMVHPFATGNNRALMLNYVKVASRSLAKNRFFTLINVVGLSVGMSISLLFIAMIAFVQKYDEFHVKKERMYRVITETEGKQSKNYFASSPIPLGEKMKHEFPVIEDVVRIQKNLSANATIEKKEIPLQGYFADQSFLKVFTFPLIKGNFNNALTNPHSIILTRSAAYKSFGSDDPMGKIIKMEEWGDFVVTGILEDHPKASHLQFEVIASYATLSSYNDTDLYNSDNWKNFKNNYTYLLLKPGGDPGSLQNFFNGFLKSFAEEKEILTQRFKLQDLHSIATTELSNQIGPEWGHTSFIIFGVLTLLILLPACFNYTNISISRTLKRAKEIGLRKTVGGQQSQIFIQFITETVIISLIALAGAFLIFTQIRSEFLHMLVSQEAIDLNVDGITLLYFILFAVLTGFSAGAVPAIYLSRLNPVQALKNTQVLKSITGLSFQKTLMVLQFALSLGFIMGVVIVLKQYKASLNFDFGFQQSNILDVELQGVDPQQFRTEFSRMASVNALSMSSGIIGTNSLEQSYFINPESKDSVQTAEFYIDENYLSNFGIPLVAGSAFTDDDHKNQIIVNEQFVKRFNIVSAANAIGKTFIIHDTVEVQVKGVVRDFHYTNLREPIGSFAFRFGSDQFRFANLEIATSDLSETFSELENTWHVIAGEAKFRSQFFSDEIEDAYSFYFSLIKTCGFLGFLAITISCLGLLGMVVYSAESRMKELGIRKIMGASSYELALLLSKNYLKLMVAATFIATPLTYFIFEKGMLQFQYYRTQVGTAEIIISVLIMFALGAATILSQTVKAARSNPVDTLKYE